MSRLRMLSALVFLASFWWMLAPASPAQAGVGSNTLAAGEQLASEQQLLSADGRYAARMQADGNFVVYGPSGPVWSTGSCCTGTGSKAVMQSDGNFVVYRADGSVAFSSSTAPSNGDQMVMQNDGNLVIYASGGLALWSSNGGRTPNGQDTLGNGQRLSAGSYIKSLNGQYTGIMQRDGNFVEYGPSGAVWSIGTQLGDNAFSVMQTDGNFVVYSAGGGAAYSSSTAPSSGDRLVLQDDGNLVIYDRTSRALWAKGSRISTLPNPFPCNAGDNSCVDYTGFNPNISNWGQAVNSKGNCTNYAAFRLAGLHAQQLTGSGDAISWRQRAINQFGAVVANGSPRVGAVAWFGTKAGSSGHVAIVDQVDGSTIWITESIWNKGSRRRVLTPGASYPDSFLHIAPGT